MCGCAGSGTGGTNPGLPLDADPLDAHRTDRLDDPEELLNRRRAKDPAAFDKVHGKGASFAEETGGKGGGEICFVLTCCFCSPSSAVLLLCAAGATCADEEDGKTGQFCFACS